MNKRLFYATIIVFVLALLVGLYRNDSRILRFDVYLVGSIMGYLAFKRDVKGKV